jgi:hypothetical protein
MFVPRGGCKHPVIASEKSPSRISPRVAALASGMVGKSEKYCRCKIFHSGPVTLFY